MAELPENVVKSDDGVSTTAAAVTPEGGENKDKKLKGKPAEKMDKVEESTDSEEVEVVEEEVVEVEDSIATIVEGLDLTEEFKNKISVVFEAAVTEQVSTRVQKIEEELAEKLETDLSEAVETKITEIVENLDAYLDYVVNEWMQENEVAIEAGIKVEMAESLMDGLKGLFEEHHIEVDEETIDVVSNMEEEISQLEEKSNAVVNENIELMKQVATLKCEAVFTEATSDLTLAEQERLKILSENLDTSDVEEYADNLKTIKESFFANDKTSNIDDAIDEEDEIITEEQGVKRDVSDYHSINALVEALNARK